MCTITKRGIALVSGIALAGLAAAGLWGIRTPHDDSESANLAILQGEAAPQWHWRARVSWTGASRSARRGGSPAFTLSPDAEIALGTLEKAVGSSRSTDARLLATLGLVRLLQDRASAGVSLLERARAAAPDNPLVASGLASAYYVRRTPGDLTRALDVAAGALGTAASSAAICFDAGLLADELLPAAARDRLWNSCRAARDRTAPPADLRGQPGRVNGSTLFAGGRGPHWDPEFQAARDELFDRVLPAWASACAEPGAAGAGHYASRAREIVRALEDRSLEDRGPEAAIAPILQRPGCAGRQLYVDYFAAMELYRADRLADAHDRFAGLVGSAGWSGNPLVLEAEAFAAITGYFGSERESALDRLVRVARQAEARGFCAVAARASWFEGYILEDRNDFAAALRAYRHAADQFARAGDVNGLGSAHSLIADVLDWLGDGDAAWRENELALSLLSVMTDSRARYSVLSWAERVSAREGLTSAALTFATAALSEPNVQQSASRAAGALVELARVEAEAGMAARARQHLEQALARGAAIDTPGGIARLRANAMSVEAALSRDHLDRARILTAAIDDYSRTGSQIAVARLLLRRGRAYAEAGRRAEAARDFEEGIGRFESARASIPDAGLRLSYFDEAWGLFESYVKLLADAGDYAGALRVAERSRARELESAVRHAGGPAGDDLGARLATIPADTLALYYFVLDDRVLIWTLSADGSTCRAAPVSRTTLKAEVAELLAAVDSRRPAEPEAARLFELLIRPALSQQRHVSRLLIIPDALLQPVPFAALWDARARRYLVQDAEIQELPALWALGAAAPPAAAGGSPLIVGGPASVQSTGAPLPGAQTEGEAIAHVYPDARLLAGSAATKQAFLDGVAHADLVHFAGHAVADPETPGLSRLMFVNDTGDDDPLFAFELRRKDLSHVRLVVLAACDTGVGRTYRSEGTASLARAFLQAGVGDVVATLWRIDDTTAAALFTKFHRRLAAGTPPPAALRLAQLDLLNDPDPERRAPQAWAGVAAYGIARSSIPARR